jgi:hypothetical protein
MSAAFFTPEFLAAVLKNAYMSPSTWHKVLNPFCAECLAQRGKEFLEERKEQK